MAATALALSSSGEVVLLAALLGVAAGELAATMTAALAGLAFAARWGTTSLDAISGAQAVLGPAGVVGPPLAAASAWCGAAALVLAVPGRWAAPAFGLAAGLGVAGPSAATLQELAVRVGAGGAGAALALAVDRVAPPRVARPAALALAAAAGVLALLP